MPDLTILSLRGGMNNTDPAIGLPEDQCTLAQNVEFVDSLLGERRLGTSAITLPSFLSARDRVTFLFRHLPTADDTAAQLWALGVTGTSTAKLGYKTTAWTEVTISDTPTLTGLTQYRWQAVTLHGKIHFAYKSNVDRLHVWDGTTMRRSGLAEPAAPTAANQGAGSINTVRYYRVRYIEKSGSTVLRRSEPSDVLTFDPTSAGAVRVTKPAAINEGETHWELEASTDNSTFYVLATTVVATTTYDDSTADGAGYSSGVQSEDVGDYALAWSARYLVTDEDRLIWLGSWDDDALASRVGWSPVFNADGDGNDERMETDTDPTLDLDTYQYGPITGAAAIFGGIWVFKQQAIYKLTRSGKRTAAYRAKRETDAIGAIHGSVVTGVDETGQPCIYFIDEKQGPCRIGIGGFKRCGEDLRKTWETLNLDATAVACSSLYYPKKKQVFWNLAVESDNTPTKRLVLHADKGRTFADGVRKGWALWTGNIAKALTMCLFSDNIEDNTTRSRDLVPFIGLEGLSLVHRCDTGTTDNSVAYTATITTRPYALGGMLAHFEVRAAALSAKAVSNASMDVKCIRDAGLETTVTVSGVSFTATASETDVVKPLDNFIGAEMRLGQFQFTDVSSPAAQWQINRLDVVGSAGQGL
ncbi:MAG TPA: hypothetical protein VEA69_01430 [Tepidisphaeraceae bacterium]|nr:hypothetical protein [Tepidisphaeraceae bacterium]